MSELLIVLRGEPSAALWCADASEGMHGGNGLAPLRVAELGSESIEIACLRTAWTHGVPCVRWDNDASLFGARAVHAACAYHAPNAREGVTSTSLRASWTHDPERAHSDMRALGLRWDTSALRRSVRWVGHGDVLRTTSDVFVVEVAGELAHDDARDRASGATIAETEARSRVVWVPLDVASARWRAGELQFTPSGAYALATALGTDSDESHVLASIGAWPLLAHLSMLPVRTPTLPPATHTNAFLFGERRGFLVEPACPEKSEIERVLTWVRARGVTIEAILLTHHHPDHVGGARALAEALGAPLWAHANTATALGTAVPIARHIGDGEELSTGESWSVRAMHTPGHAHGHLCFTDAVSNLMLAGDMLAGVGSIIVEPIDGDMQLYLASLRRMLSVEPSGLLPAHGGWIRDPQAKLEHYVAHRLHREALVVEALKQQSEPCETKALLDVAYADTPRPLWPLAVRALEAHLIKLEREGRATRNDARWAVTRS